MNTSLFSERKMKEYKDRIDILDKAVKDNWSLSELIEEFGDFIIFLGFNSSGVDVVNLKSMEVDEFTF